MAYFGSLASHDEAKLISKTLPEKHTKHCVLEKDSLNPLCFAKRCVAGLEISRERPTPWFSEASKFTLNLRKWIFIWQMVLIDFI